MLELELTPRGALKNIISGLKEMNNFEGYEIDVEVVEKALEALEIIKEKNVDVLRIKITANVDMYNERRIKGCRNITQEEYELLKEVLL